MTTGRPIGSSALQSGAQLAARGRPPLMLGRAAAHAAAGIWFVLYAAAVSYPLILRLGTHIPGDGAGDNVTFLWNFWWFRQALAEPASSFFFTDFLFAPFGTPLVLHTHTALPALTGATLLAPLAADTAQNVVLLLGLAGNGIAAYALGYHTTRRILSAVLVGVVFAGSAYVSIRLLGHFNLVHAWILPLVALLWIRWLDAPTAGRGVAVGLAFAAAAYTDYYYFVYASLMAAGWWLLSVWTVRAQWRPGRARAIERGLVVVTGIIAALIVAIVVTGGFAIEVGPWRISATRIRNPLAALWVLWLCWLAQRIRVSITRIPEQQRGASRLPVAAAAGAAVFFLLILPLAVPAARLIAAGDYVSPTHTWRSSPRGIDLATTVLGNPLNALYGHHTRAAYTKLEIDLMEQVGWLGFVPLLLVLGLVKYVRGDSHARRWAILGGFFLVWSLGPFLVVGGTDTGIPLPQWLARFVPLLSNARIPGRAFAAVQLAAALLSGVAVLRFRWPRAAVLAAIGLSTLEVVPARIPMFPLPRSGRIESTLASAGGQVTVLELPFGLRDGFGEAGRFDHRALVFQIGHGRPIAGGFVARLPPRIGTAYRNVPAISALLQYSAGAAPSLPADFAGQLASLGITHIVVNSDAIDGAERLLEDTGLRLLITEGTRELYAVGEQK